MCSRRVRRVNTGLILSLWAGGLRHCASNRGRTHAGSKGIEVEFPPDDLDEALMEYSLDFLLP